MLQIQGFLQMLGALGTCQIDACEILPEGPTDSQHWRICNSFLCRNHSKFALGPWKFTWWGPWILNRNCLPRALKFSIFIICVKHFELHVICFKWYVIYQIHFQMIFFLSISFGTDKEFRYSAETKTSLVMQSKLYQSHKSHNAPVPYPTIHHSQQRCAHYCCEWCIVGYWTGAF